MNEIQIFEAITVTKDNITISITPFITEIYKGSKSSLEGIEVKGLKDRVCCACRVDYRLPNKETFTTNIHNIYKDKEGNYYINFLDDVIYIRNFEDIFKNENDIKWNEGYRKNNIFY